MRKKLASIGENQRGTSPAIVQEREGLNNAPRQFDERSQREKSTGSYNNHHFQFSRWSQLDFLKFLGEDLRSWLFKVEQFFNMKKVIKSDILVDIGSSRNFIDPEVVKEIGCQVTSTTPQAVTAANDNNMHVSKMCRLSWLLQGVEFSVEFWLLPLGSCGVVLGVQWLLTLGDIKMNFRDLTIEFWYKGRKHILKGFGRQIKTTGAGKLAKISGINSQLCMIQVVPSMTSKDQWYSVDAKESLEGDPRLMTLLHKHKTLFEEPKQLPPSRGIFDHRIVLYNNTEPINKRPYRYPFVKKDIIEGLVQQMSDQGNHSTSLRTFVASSCKIRGRIPNEVGNLSSLLDLRLSGNNLVGLIPTTIGNMRNLQWFNLSSNKLSGFIGDHICNLQHLGDIYLGQNQLSGSLPYCLGNITSLREIHLSSNKLSSNIPPSIGKLHDLVVLDLPSNNMVGSLPPEIGNLKVVIKMDLSMNQFSNRIPREIGGLQNLAHLTLRHNKLQGSIPDSMSNTVETSKPYFNVSFNKLYGEIPSGDPFKNLSSQFFIYNEALCGSSIFSVPPCPTSSNHRSNRKKLVVLFILIAIAVVFVPMTFVLLWIRYRRGKSAPQQADLLSTVVRERISYYELLQETNALSESNLIGSGSFGSVYKGILRNGTAIAVKVFNLQLDTAFKSFDTECEVLCSLRHRNLVKVITSCSNLDFKALVLEYMPNGSLEKYLYSHNYFLDIRQRLSIMIDVACALEYLHHGCLSVLIHCDLKPSNVLLDEDMVAHLSDFGISKLLCDDESDLYTETLATLGYIAPEYGLDGLVSTKCDIYSYGIMLLETFTRRKPNEFDRDLSLKQWVSYSLPEGVMDVVDANLLTSTGNRLQKELDVVASIMKVALDCCAESPARRTNMKDVVGMLQKIKIQLLAC
ncbi:hypothetical protein T459_11196 [Capsicum annuum]|uniref:non-specific serine/threonine protein kinase n=1 Tax=Capsicum annuum TaxID=4072 RepID=A0A2G2ZLA9_CAPAN|nr:hypothetical protein T459_11196 [Capsicum annuum]